MNHGKPLVIFTDLDGTLLDAADYSFSAASDALALLARQRIPLVVCSSKTRAELEMIQQDLGIHHPFISENGGALFIPPRYFHFPLPGTRRFASYDVVEFGQPYWLLVDALHREAERVGVEVVGFSDMSIEELAIDCGLPLAEARLAKLREYDEPFRFVDQEPKKRNRLFGALHDAGLRCTQGGRYYHLTGNNDKGTAVRTLKRFYEMESGGRVRAVGLGDSLNDLPLLQEVEVPIVVPGPAADATTRLLRKVPTARLASAVGPRGWNNAILEIASAVSVAI